MTTLIQVLSRDCRSSKRRSVKPCFGEDAAESWAMSLSGDGGGGRGRALPLVEVAAQQVSRDGESVHRLYRAGREGRGGRGDAEAKAHMANPATAEPILDYDRRRRR